MMWSVCFVLALGILFLAALVPLVIGWTDGKRKHKLKHKLKLFNALFVGVFLASIVLFWPIHHEGGLWNGVRAAFLCVFNAIQLYAAGCEFAVVTDGMGSCPQEMAVAYQVLVAGMFVLAPLFTFGFVLSLFRNITAYLRFLWGYFRDAYVFSELNDRALQLATNIRSKHPKALIVFTDVFEKDDEKSFEMTEAAEKLGAIFFKTDIAVLNCKYHSTSRKLMFFTIGEDETEDLDQTLKLIERYRDRPNTHIYVFSTRIESELLLTAVDKGQIRVRRINEVQSLVDRLLYERGKIIFDSAREGADGIKRIGAVIVGMGRHGDQMLRSLSWFGQMDGYDMTIDAFDKDPLAKERFVAKAPELMSDELNGTEVPGETRYRITIHPDTDVDTASFAQKIAQLRQATYVLVALGSDELNINTAIRLRMYFERLGIHPVIQAIVYDPHQKKALEGIRNYRNVPYDIQFIGDREEAYTEEVILGTALEAEALRSHLKWGNEEEFWTYEYNYRSSVASAIHRQARAWCQIPGSDKKESELTQRERDIIEVLEHRRWNAYMRSEGYVYSGSPDSKTRNDLAKMHHNLVPFEGLSEKDKRKDSAVGTG